MSMSNASTGSVWMSGRPPHFPALSGDLSVDVAIVGGGITGMTAAASLADAGRSVAVLEKNTVASGETGRTTAHLTEFVDAGYRALASDFGREGARLVAETSRAAIDRLEGLARAHRLSCAWRRLPGYLYTEGDLAPLRTELEAARRAGVAVELTTDVPLPFRTQGALRFAHQAELHPRAFVLGLARALAGRGVGIFEHTTADDIVDGEPCRVATRNGTVTARAVVVAAHVPVNNRVFMHTKIAAYRSYAVAGAIPAPLDGLFWDTDDPYHYMRTHRRRGGALLIVGGEDHKVGQDPDTTARFARLATWAGERFGIDQLPYRWSGQIIEPVDGLPYVGRNPLGAHVYVATGFAGNGMTFGPLAAMLTTDAILGRAHPAASLYAATRVKPLAAIKDYVRENVDFPRYLVADRLTSADASPDALALLPRGGGRIVAIDGHKRAVARDDAGVLHSVSPACTHLGCDVRWNSAERTWDCPCHGSRFAPDGRVLNGPAIADLTPEPLPATLVESAPAARRRPPRRAGRPARPRAARQTESR
jgi:glycine/D-amino acid oxidase-like deaminating enzyme/nitrite reductase/ring-hydroxylating ferredoxin subunit